MYTLTLITKRLNVVKEYFDTLQDALEVFNATKLDDGAYLSLKENGLIIAIK